MAKVFHRLYNANMLKKVNLSPKEQRIAAAHLNGAKNKDIGNIEYPQATKQSQAVLVSRQLKKPNVAQYVEQEKLQVLKQFKVTWESIVRPRVDALQAVKIVTSHTEPDYEIADHSIRLKAAADLERMMSDKQQQEPAPLYNLPAGLDEIQILRAFKSPPKQD